ncbi:MAG: 6-carboxytetrahydropterin synthase QueD [Patescibacteria group bacterium]
MNISVNKQFKFEAAHGLPKYDGKCKNVHGHSYVFEISISGPIITEGPKEGMVIDFGDISKVVDKNIIDKWDHQYLNDVVTFNPTAENLAVEILKITNDSGLSVNKVKLWETANSFVEVMR